MSASLILPAPRRRDLLLGLAGAALAAPAVLRAQSRQAQPPIAAPFQLGVASGDPAPDGFVIWTRLAPQPLEQHSGMPMKPVTVDYEVAADERFAAVVARGSSLARPELGHSVHVEVEGLQPGRPYWYRFHLGAETSPTGRSRTLPPPGARLAKVRFVSGGCQNYQQGLYTAYRGVANEDLDFFWHYGDYIYEEGGRAYNTGHDGVRSATVRQHAGQKCYSLDDYRQRYAQYRTDPDLQAAHAAHPWWVTWDDHEVDNNWASQYDEDGTPPEVFNLRRQSAAQAYYENMPLRRTAFPHGYSIQIFRRASYGDLLDCHFLDTRQFRMDQPCGDNFKTVCPEALAPDRTIMGAEEERWLFDGLSTGTRRWNWIANQVMMMPLDRRTSPDQHEPIWNMDSWAGYPAARKRLLDHIEAGAITNVVVTTGDEHQNYGGELRSGGRPDGRTLAVEFVATSISSGGDGSDLRKGSEQILSENPHLKFINDLRGYVVSEVGRDTWKADYRVVEQVRQPGGRLSTRKSFVVERGRPGLSAA